MTEVIRLQRSTFWSLIVALVFFIMLAAAGLWANWNYSVQTKKLAYLADNQLPAAMIFRSDWEFVLGKYLPSIAVAQAKRE